MPAQLMSQLSLDEVLDDNSRKWETLTRLAEGSDPTHAEFTAAGFPVEVRVEAAKKLISNHVAVLKDITNPAPKTQTELPRVDRSLAQFVDLFLLETARRLLGRREQQLEASMLDRFLTVDLEQVKDERAAEAWAHSARFLTARIQIDPAHFEGRRPDMSKDGSRAFLAVCNELGEPSPKWRALRGLVDATDGHSLTQTAGIAAQQLDEARYEAAKKLILNHRRVLLDITNPDPQTQTELARLPAFDRPQVDRFLIEMARRLSGHRQNVEAEALHHMLEEKLPSDKAGRATWAAAATFLSGRIQAVPNQHPGRKPDMSIGAAIAFVQVAEEVAFGEAKFLPFLDGLPGPASAAA